MSDVDWRLPVGIYLKKENCHREISQMSPDLVLARDNGTVLVMDQGKLGDSDHMMIMLRLAQGKKQRGSLEMFPD